MTGSRTRPSRPRPGPRTQDSRPKTGPRTEDSRPRPKPRTVILSLRTTQDQGPRPRTTSLPYTHLPTPNFGNRPVPTNRGVGRGKMSDIRPLGRGARLRSAPQFNGQWRGNNYDVQQYSPQYSFSAGQPENVRRNCPKCEKEQQANILLYPAYNRMCLCCGRFGHFARMCRHARVQQA